MKLVRGQQNARMIIRRGEMHLLRDHHSVGLKRTSRLHDLGDRYSLPVLPGEKGQPHIGADQFDLGNTICVNVGNVSRIDTGHTRLQSTDMEDSRHSQRYTTFTIPALTTVSPNLASAQV